MNNLYESKTLLSEYLFFHYGHAEDYLPWKFGPKSALDYPLRCVTECFDLERLHPTSHALDVGCAVGRSSFELAHYCQSVIGIDSSHAFIEAARTLASEGAHPYTYVREGTHTGEASAQPPEGIDRSRVTFEQGDAMSLRPDLKGFEAVLAANLICRLTHPRHFLLRCRDLVCPGGQLVITTPFTWLEDYTAPQEWIGGHPATGESLRALRQVLEPDFSLEWTENLPFLIREHRRKYQWSVAQACRFIRHQ